MHDHSARSDRRLDRRIPLGCRATIHPPSGVAVSGVCVELSVGGMTLHTAYVPRAQETLRVTVDSPTGATPLVAELEVKRCHALGNGLYELGGAIVQVLS